MAVIFHFLPVVFNKLSGEQAVLQLLSYIVANLLGLAMAMYKCHTMGLLPTAQSDWVEFMDQQQVGLLVRVSLFLCLFCFIRVWSFHQVVLPYHDKRILSSYIFVHEMSFLVIIVVLVCCWLCVLVNLVRQYHSHYCVC